MTDTSPKHAATDELARPRLAWLTTTTARHIIAATLALLIESILWAAVIRDPIIDCWFNTCQLIEGDDSANRWAFMLYLLPALSVTVLWTLIVWLTFYARMAHDNRYVIRWRNSLLLSAIVLTIFAVNYGLNIGALHYLFG